MSFQDFSIGRDVIFVLILKDRTAAQMSQHLIIHCYLCNSPIFWLCNIISHKNNMCPNVRRETCIKRYIKASGRSIQMLVRLCFSFSFFKAALGQNLFNQTLLFVKSLAIQDQRSQVFLVAEWQKLFPTITKCATTFERERCLNFAISHICICLTCSSRVSFSSTRFNVWQINHHVFVSVICYLEKQPSLHYLCQNPLLTALDFTYIYPKLLNLSFYPLNRGSVLYTVMLLVSSDMHQQAFRRALADFP